MPGSRISGWWLKRQWRRSPRKTRISPPADFHRQAAGENPMDCRRRHRGNAPHSRCERWSRLESGSGASGVRAARPGVFRAACGERNKFDLRFVSVRTMAVVDHPSLGRPPSHPCRRRPETSLFHCSTLIKRYSTATETPERAPLWPRGAAGSRISAVSQVQRCRLTTHNERGRVLDGE